MALRQMASNMYHRLRISQQTAKRIRSGTVPSPPESLEIRQATEHDHDRLFTEFARIVDAREGFPQAPPLERPDFDDYWIAHSSSVVVAIVHDALVGAYHVKPNFVGRAAHIANAGYFVSLDHRGRGIGAALGGPFAGRGAPTWASTRCSSTSCSRRIRRGESTRASDSGRSAASPTPSKVRRQ